MYELEQSLTLAEYLKNVDLEYEVVGNAEVLIRYVDSIFNIAGTCRKEGGVSYCAYESEDKASVIEACESSVIIAHMKLKERLSAQRPPERTYIFTENPKLLFVLMFQKTVECIRSANVSISSGADIAEGVYIGADCVIEDKVVVGEECHLDGLNHIKKCTTIQSGVVIGSGCKIGVEGLSFAERGEQKLQMPSFGGTQIGRNVWLGANTVVIRGLLADTVIGDGCIIGNLCNIGHECKIGKNTFISAGVTLCGGVEIGDNCWIGPGVTILQKVSIGSGTKIGIGALVVRDIPEGMFAAGNPARVISTAEEKGAMV